MPSWSSTNSTPSLVHADGPLAQVDLVVHVFFHQRRQAGRTRGTSSTTPSAGPEMISGVRASSIRMESTSSTIAKLWPRWTQVVQRVGHVVAQVVEAELVVGAVGDVGGVSHPPLVGRHLREDHADVQAQEAVHPAHPLAVPFGQIVVDGDDVHALAGHAVEVGRQHQVSVLPSPVFISATLP